MGSNRFESGRLAASMVNKIFNDTAAGTIPAVSPENFIQINYKVAQEFGWTIPEGLLKLANEIIH